MSAVVESGGRRRLHRGASRTIRLASTTGAAPPTWPVPGDGIYLLEAVTFTLATNAGGAARTVIVQYADETGTIAAAVAAPFTLAGGKTSVFSFVAGGQQFGANDAAYIGAPLPSLRLTSHFTIYVVEDAGNVSDAFAEPRLIVREWSVPSGDD